MEGGITFWRHGLSCSDKFEAEFETSINLYMDVIDKGLI